MPQNNSEIWPKVEIGTHLAVIHYEDGQYELHWDDEVLLQEVKDAIASVENKNG
jgi:hypothetical protein